MAILALNGATGDALLAEIEQHALAVGASDIHTSPERTGVRVERRLHGQLELLGTLTMEAYDLLLRTVKFKSQLKLNITSLPQDGQYTFPADQRIVNVRVATLPSRFGEAVTLRFLDPARGLRSLQELGFPPDMEKQLQDLVRLPHGLMLVTGPTGSGKTTTLYALLTTIVGTARNIMTLEDPIEYELPGVIQSEVAPDKGYTFASGLRSILRHDPNVILVGEIRDLETAQTAIDASLTGHLVFATLHTNSAIEAIPRLLSMGVSPYTFAPALRGILAQRLIRTVRADLRGKQYDPADPLSYDGRIVLPELLIATPALRDLLLRQTEESAILEQATQDGFLPMRAQGELLLQQGIVTNAELSRVTEA